WPAEDEGEIARVLQRTYDSLVADLGNFGTLDWPDVLPASFGETGRYLYAYVFLGAVEDVRAYHRDRGIPDEISWATLADFGRHFPETPARIAVCTSWLLDEHLADYLPADSNVVRFGRRFALTGGSEGDLDILQFVFGRLTMPDLAELPQRTALERAIVAHWRAGKHWRSRTGWLEL